MRRTLYGHFAGCRDLVVALVQAAAAEFTADAEVREAMAPHHERMVRLIALGQRAGAFGTHLPAATLALLLHSHSEVHLTAGRADGSAADGDVGQLITLGVGEAEARTAVDRALHEETTEG